MMLSLLLATAGWLRHAELASRALGESRPATAAWLLQRAIRRQPDHAEIHAALGVALAASGDANGAIASVERAIFLS